MVIDVGTPEKLVSSAYYRPSRPNHYRPVEREGESFPLAPRRVGAPTSFKNIK